MSNDLVRMTVDLEGIVQGVGFRPTMKRLAQEIGIGGWVQNRTGTVRMELEGSLKEIEYFLRVLPNRIPPQARIDRLSRSPAEKIGYAPGKRHFTIRESNSSDSSRVSIPADLAACPECMAEVFDPANRRHGYPFTTCTQCGPRYTVVDGMPYDRERTTLSRFPLCSECRNEYENESDRRFHAESIACPACGPKCRLIDSRGNEIDSDPIREARRFLSSGEIVAVRGLGGFLLAADAFNPDALRELRRRKNRPHKPFAVMARNAGVLRRYAEFSGDEEDLLEGSVAPIVILETHPQADGTRPLPLDLITPDGRTIGAMLPTTPLHRLLFEPLNGDPTAPFDLLVMTSGNKRSEPICITNEEALERLSGIADKFLLHDRDINLRNDDSLCVFREGRPQVWRRARGFAPDAVKIKRPLKRRVLAMGAELKNTIAVGFDNQVVLSPHIGDLETPEAIVGLETVVRRLPEFLKRAPEAVAIDLHPDMHASVLGRKYAQARDLPVVRVQHHHAHAASCMAENGIDDALALVFDGTGYGSDGAIWGAELLNVYPGDWKRLGTFAGVPLPGGDAAVLHPVRQLAGRFHKASIPFPENRIEEFHIRREEIELWNLQCVKGLNAPVTHAAGRLFDSFAAALGLASEAVTYEGQAAIRLENEAKLFSRETAPLKLPYVVERIDDLIYIDWSETFRFLAAQNDLGGNRPEWARAFHLAVANAAAEMAIFGRDQTGKNTIALTGGVFMNGILARDLMAILDKNGFQVITHEKVPPNDGGIALGQAVIAGGML
jgi:hydrogenase maturation protein HypF